MTSMMRQIDDPIARDYRVAVTIECNSHSHSYIYTSEYITTTSVSLLLLWLVLEFETHRGEILIFQHKIGEDLQQLRACLLEPALCVVVHCNELKRSHTPGLLLLYF